MKNINIRLFDDEEYSYPIITIKSDSLETFKKDLDKYRSGNDTDYTYDEFLKIIKTKPYFVKETETDIKIFF